MLTAATRFALCDRIGQHALTEEPRDADLILFIDFQQHPGDWWMGAFHRHPLVRAYPEKICVYDERDEPWYSAPGVYVSLSRRTARLQSQTSGCYFTLKNEGAEANLHNFHPDLLFSFMGSMSHPIRRKIVQLSHPRAVVEDTSQFNFFVSSEDEAGQKRVQHQKERYREVVLRSKFVLCPRGFGTSSYRLFETLSLGRVPVILSDDWVRQPGPDWDRCAIFVPEREVASMPRLLEAREREFPELAANARLVWDTWFAPEVRFHTLIETCQSLKAAQGQGVCRFPKLQSAALRKGLRMMRANLKNRLKKS
jgi:hypothetical protein